MSRQSTPIRRARIQHRTRWRGRGTNSRHALQLRELRARQARVRRAGNIALAVSALLLVGASWWHFEHPSRPTLGPSTTVTTAGTGTVGP